MNDPTQIRDRDVALDTRRDVVECFLPSIVTGIVSVRFLVTPPAPGKWAVVIK